MPLPLGDIEPHTDHLTAAREETRHGSTVANLHTYANHVIAEQGAVTLEDTRFCLTLTISTAHESRDSSSRSSHAGDPRLYSTLTILYCIRIT